MFGWEFPPYTSGGLGTACYALTKGLARNGLDITFVVPYLPEDQKVEFVKLVGANTIANITIIPVNSTLTQYSTFESYEERIAKLKSGLRDLYGHNLYIEVIRYSIAAAQLASQYDHDVIHCHDWMTYQAGMNAKEISGKPLIIHIHNTVFDRSSLKPNEIEYQIERMGFENADKIIAISNKIKNTLVSKYGIEPNKISVVHWGIEEEDPDYHLEVKKPFNTKIVMFVGRVTLQKGPDYFVEAASQVLKYEPDTRFVVVGSGDMLPRIINRAIELGIIDRFNFTGWFSKRDVYKVFKLADVFVMPSVSEPFGLVALEALKNNVPVIISKQSGVSEVLKHCLKVDFWDVNELSNKIVSVLKYKVLYQELKNNGFNEVNKFNLDEPAKKVITVYNEARQW
ncbi:glycosyltransferase family 4 protein [Candidatus Woesearchaeota archaeon]|nr:glycosyltransferase family 4 protein [Candidatus Woesearchaeota archaeon]